MTALIIFHTTASIIAFALMALVTVGFAPHLRFRGHDANSLMSMFVALSSGLVWVRLLWWSILRPGLGEMGLMAPAVYTAPGQIINGMFAVWAIIAALAALGALHRSLPEPERTYYNWLTAPFYPRRACLWRI